MVYFQLTHLSLWCLFCVDKANGADPDQTPQDVASDQGLHCLLTEDPIKIPIHMKNTTK